VHEAPGRVGMQILCRSAAAHNCFMLQMIAQYAPEWTILEPTGNAASRE
jgi:hypothetical protein